MKDQLISFNTAKLAKEKGYNVGHDNSTAYSIEKGYQTLADRLNYNDILYAPTQSVLQKWLREVYRVNISILPSFSCYNIDKIFIYNKIEDENIEVDLDGLNFKDFKIYEEALEEALQKALKLIKN